MIPLVTIAEGSPANLERLRALLTTQGIESRLVAPGACSTSG